MDVSAELLCSIVASVKAQRSRSLSKEEKLDIVLLYAKLRHKTPGVSLAKQVAQLLNRKTELVQNTWAEFMQSRTVTVAVVAANCGPRTRRVPDTNLVKSSVQEFVRTRR